MSICVADFQFFYDHAGYARYEWESDEQAKHRNAVSLASAEAWLAARIAKERARIEWVADDDMPDDARGDISLEDWRESIDLYGHMGCQIWVKRDDAPSDPMYEAKHVWICAASLYSIVGDSDYHRVVAAELASEARTR